MKYTAYLPFLAVALCFGVGKGFAHDAGDCSSAPVVKFQKFEGEVFGGLSLPIGPAEAGTKKAGWNVGAEVRYNFPKSPFDAGLQYSHASYGASCTSFRLNTLMATGDYNFNRYARFTPFVGMGAGATFVGGDYDKTMFAVMPRVGVEFNDWLRLTASAQFSQKYFHNMQVSLGLVLGGRRKTVPCMDLYVPTFPWQSSASDPAIKCKKRNAQSFEGRQLFTEDQLRILDLQKEMRKHKRYGTTYAVLGGVSLGVGAVGTAMGITAFAKSNGDPVSNTFGAIFTSGGGLLMLGSVPLFIASHVQSTKAAQISAVITTLSDPGLGSAHGLGLTLRF